MNASMGTSLDVSLLFSDANDKHGVWFIVSISMIIRKIFETNSSFHVK